jgi:hydrogenase expression/formation protein HypD
VNVGEARVVNAFPRCVTRQGNLRAQETLWRVFRPIGGRWRGIAQVPNGNLRLRDEWARFDARRRFAIDASELAQHAPVGLAQACRCGDIMAGIARRKRPVRARVCPRTPVAPAWSERRDLRSGTSMASPPSSPRSHDDSRREGHPREERGPRRAP